MRHAQVQNAYPEGDVVPNLPNSSCEAIPQGGCLFVPVKQFHNPNPVPVKRSQELYLSNEARRHDTPQALVLVSPEAQSGARSSSSLLPLPFRKYSLDDTTSGAEVVILSSAESCRCGSLYFPGIE